MSGADLRPPIGLAFEAFGVAAVVTRPAPNDTPIDTTVLWVGPLPEDAPPGAGLQRQEPRRVLALRLADVPSVPRGTLIEASESESDAVATKTWRVDGVDRIEPEHVRVIVVPYVASS